MTVNKSIKRVKPRKTRFTRTYYKILDVSQYVHDCWNNETNQYEKVQTYDTPYVGMSVELGKDYEIPENKKWELYGDSVTNKTTYVEGGCFHLYRTKMGAESDCLNSKSKVIVKAIVPKGTEYIKGWYGFEKCICVRKVRYEEI